MPQTSGKATLQTKYRINERSLPDSIKRPLQSNCILKETGDGVLISYSDSVSSVP